MLNFTTDDLAEGSTNVYYTDARARASLSVVDTGGDGSLSYNATSGVIFFTGPSASETRAHFSVEDTNSIDMTYSTETGVFSSAAKVDDSSIEVNESNGLQVKAGGITNAMLSGSITNGNLANSTITIGADAISLGGSISDIDLNGAGSLILDADANTKIRAAADDDMRFEVGSDSAGLKLTSSGLFPLTAGMDLGNASNYFSNVFTGDLHLKNERGNWTIFEETDHLRVRNNLTGQTYMMGMTLIDDQ